DLARAIPGAGLSGAAHGAVAGEAELAAVAGRALEHHRTDGLREGRVLHPVQHNLGDGGLATRGLAAGFEIDGLGQAIELTVAVERRAEPAARCGADLEAVLRG